MDRETVPLPSPAQRLAAAGRLIAATATRAWRLPARLALDVVLPHQCVACPAPVHGDGLCAACWSRLAFIAPPYCERLGLPFAYDPGPGLLSMEAIARPPAFQRARAAVRYDEVAKTLVHALKYHDRTDLAPVMGRWMAQAGGMLLADADALVPVPLHWRRGFGRRYNQAALLAGAVSRHHPQRPAVRHDLVKRIRHTPHQVGLSHSERAANMQGAFAVAAAQRPLVRGLRLVLIDDVLTSGATAEACARALLRAGAARVDVLVFARVVETI